MSPTFAIITPTIGHEHLSRCLMSVKHQTLRDVASRVTHIVVADGPQRPEVKAACEMYGLNTHYVELPVKAGGWGGPARNKGIELVETQFKADYVIFCDDDNMLFPNSLKAFDIAAQNNYIPPLIYQDVLTHSRHSPGVWVVLPFHIPPVYGTWDMLNACIRSDVLKGVRFDEDYTHDWRVTEAVIKNSGANVWVKAEMGMGAMHC